MWTIRAALTLSLLSGCGATSTDDGKPASHTRPAAEPRTVSIELPS